MDGAELFRAGKLQEAIAAQTALVKSRPGDQSQRLLLFELLAFAGELERAKRQLDALQYDQLELQAAAAEYRKLLDVEETRRKLFRDGTQPKFLGTGAPPEHIRLRLEAIERLRTNRPAEAAECLAQAAEAAPAVAGLLNGQPFADLRDCDDLFGPVLEVFAQGNYFWVPLDFVELINIAPPKFPRDLLWVKARLETAAGAGQVYLPALYPGSYEHADDAVKLGRMTDWTGDDGSPVIGRGLRMFLADEETSTLLEWREVQINPPAEDAAAADESPPAEETGG
jgi:type VI secretion system protein ImpE